MLTLVERVIDMSRMKKSTVLLTICVSTAIALAILVILAITRTLNPQNFAIGCAIVMIVSIIVMALFLRRTKESAEASGTMTASNNQISYRSKHIRVVLILLWLVFALWFTRGGSWVPRLIGASVLVLFLIGTLLRKANGSS